MYIELPQRQLAIAVPTDQLHIDPVLNLPDRFGLGAIIEQVLQHAAQHQVMASYFVIGIDRMKMLSQAFGARVAHDILSATAQTLVKYAADRAHVCWLGGDMFAVLMLNVDENDINKRAADMLALFRDPLHPWPQDLHVTVSVGGAVIPSAAITVHDVMTAGETALQQAKLAGRNCFSIYNANPAAEDELRESIMIATRVQQALNDNALHLAYQPVVCSTSGRILFYEALARLFSESGEPIPAAHFIPAVEKLGLAYQLDCRVMMIAVAELKAHNDLQLAVNISAGTAEHPEWPDYLERALEGRRDLASRLIVEITETVQIRDMAVARRFVDFTQGLGSRVALDDFGAGYTTVQQLTGLSVRLMKIDRAMVVGIDTNTQQQEVMRAMIALARSLNLKIVAEGVEDPKVAAWLTAEKVEMQQGYHHGHPAFDRPWNSTAA